MCSGFPSPLEASVSAGATYQWKKDGVDIPAATAATFTPVDLGVAQYSVAITSDGCTKTSAQTQVEVISQAALPAPTLTEDAPICKGAALTIEASSAGATGYRWTGPAGFTQTVASGPVTRSNFEAAFAGRYEVDVLVGTCVAQKGFIIAEMITLPDFKVGFTGNDIICAGASKTVTVDPSGSGFTYQWFTTAGGAIGGATANSHNVNASGEYFYQAQSTDFPACPPASSNKVTFKVVSLPTVSFTSPATTCTNTVVTFTNTSTLDPDAGANFLWDFGDTGTSDAISPTHTYATTGNFNVKLVAAYRGNTCATQLIKPITVTALPTATITSTTNAFSFCPGDNLVLGVSSSFTSYLWSTNATTPTIEVSAAGTYSVQLTNANGCKITPTQVVTQLVPPTVTATSERPTINIGESTQLTATPGLSSYLWTPAETLSSATIANPIATPEEKTTYVVVATASNGCEGEATVEVDVTFDDIVNLLQPGNFISPNGDAINDTWEVGRITSFPQCGVKIFDEKGSKVYDALPYQNDWNAVLNGKPLPNGVYFYFIQCEGESESKTGSITVVH
jgi:gliding motility-associated-like protein